MNVERIATSADPKWKLVGEDAGACVERDLSRRSAQLEDAVRLQMS